MANSPKKDSLELYSGNIKKYKDFVHRHSITGIKKLADEPNFINSLGESIWSDIFGVPSGKAIVTKRSDYDLFIQRKIFIPFTEICSSYEALKNILIYISNYLKVRGVSKSTYLSYHIENYLNEIYILKGRLENYLNILEKAYLKSVVVDATKNAFKSLRDIISKTFQVYSRVRGSHVHVARYNDSNIKRLSILELLMIDEKDELTKLIKPLYEIIYKEVHERWEKKVRKDLQQVHKLMDIYFKIVKRTISNKGRIILPDNIKKPKR